jgi:hypothetical protein
MIPFLNMGVAKYLQKISPGSPLKFSFGTLKQLSLFHYKQQQQKQLFRHH